MADMLRSIMGKNFKTGAWNIEVIRRGFLDAYQSLPEDKAAVFDLCWDANTGRQIREVNDAARTFGANKRNFKHRVNSAYQEIKRCMERNPSLKLKVALAKHRFF